MFGFPCNLLKLVTHIVENSLLAAESVRSLLPVGVEIVGVCTTASAGQGSQACAEQLAKTVKAVIFQVLRTMLNATVEILGSNGLAESGACRDASPHCWWWL